MGNQVRKLRKEREMTLEELSEVSGISQSYLSRIESGERNLTIQNAVKIASAFGVEPSLVTNDFSSEDMEAAATIAPTQPQKSGDIANIDIRAGMGAGATMAVSINDDGSVRPEHVTGHWGFPPEVLSQWMHKKQTFAFRVDGDSMEPTLAGGSYVFVDTTQTFPNPPDIYVIDYGDGLMVKRVELIPKTDKILIASDSDRYPNHTLLRNDVYVWGRVVAWFQWRG